MNTSSAALLNEGMNALIDSLGIVGAEQFVSMINRERFDYTSWQREYFDRMTPDEIMGKASRFAREHPFRGKKAQIMTKERENALRSASSRSR